MVFDNITVTNIFTCSLDYLHMVLSCIFLTNQTIIHINNSGFFKGIFLFLGEFFLYLISSNKSSLQDLTNYRV